MATGTLTITDQCPYTIPNCTLNCRVQIGLYMAHNITLCCNLRLPNGSWLYMAHNITLCCKHTRMANTDLVLRLAK